MSPHKTKRNAKLGIFVVVALVFAGALLGPAIGMMSGDVEETLSQDENVTYTLKGPLVTNLTDTNTTEGTATVEVTDEDAASSESNEIGVGNTTTYTMPDGNVDVTVDAVNSDSATLTYAYPNDYGWSDAAKSLWAVIPILAVVGIVVVFGGLAIKYL